jgi:hypothetical protein
LDTAIELDETHRAGCDHAKLMLWRAQATSRLGSAQVARTAWENSCSVPTAPPIWRFDAVTELAEADLAVGLEQARQMHGTGTAFVGSLISLYLAQAALEE